MNFVSKKTDTGPFVGKNVSVPTTAKVKGPATVRPPKPAPLTQ